MISLHPTPAAWSAPARLDQSIRHYAQSRMRSRHSRLRGALLELVRQCSRADWDGFGAEPVSDKAYELARRFVAMLPDTIPMPSVGTEPDGHITFEWYRNPDHVLSVSVGADGSIYYAALLGKKRRSGTEPFNARMPTEILQLARRVKAA
jgi:hypothetical protein